MAVAAGVGSVSTAQLAHFPQRHRGWICGLPDSLEPNINIIIEKSTNQLKLIDLGDTNVAHTLDECRTYFLSDMQRFRRLLYRLFSDPLSGTVQRVQQLCQNVVDCLDQYTYHRLTFHVFSQIACILEKNENASTLATHGVAALGAEADFEKRIRVISDVCSNAALCLSTTTPMTCISRRNTVCCD